MNRQIVKGRWGVAIIAGLTIVAAMAFQGSSAQTGRTGRDTIPERNKVRDIDDALAEVEKARAELERSLKDKDFSEMERELSKAQAQISKDRERMQKEINEAMKELNSEKFQKEIKEALKELDSPEFKEQLRKEGKEADSARIRAQVMEAIGRVDVDRIKGDLERVRNIDLKRIEQELKEIKPKIEESLKSARVSQDAAKKDLEEHKALIDGLHKDGLIDKNGSYTIQYRENVLTINGKQASAETVAKYKDFLKDRKAFMITKTTDDFDIRKND